MTRALTLGSLALALSLAIPPEPSTAQSSAEWTLRPDAHAPAGVTLDHLRGHGELLFTYRLRQMEDRGTRVGPDTIPALLILQDFEMVPLEVSRQEHALALSYGLLEWVTFEASVPLVQRTAEIATETNVAETSAWGLGDVEAHALVSLHESWPYRAHLSAGFSFPTGGVNEEGVTPRSHPDPEILPYPLQYGSGTVDFTPGATFVAVNEHGTFGAQARGVLRIGENSRDYRLGNRALFTGWVAPRFTDWLSGSARVSWERWGNLSGSDPALDPMAIQMAHPFLQGGTRVDAPVGVNIHFPEGRLQGGRASAEISFPVHHDLDGPQLGRDWGFHLKLSLPVGARAAPAPEPTPSDAPATVREISTSEPEGERRTLCLATGRDVEILITPDGDTLVGPERRSVRELGDDAYEGRYATTAAWFLDDEPMEFEGYEYVSFDDEVGLDCSRIVQVGVYDEVPFFAEVDAQEPFETLFVPVSPGSWQGYERRPAVRGQDSMRMRR